MICLNLGDEPSIALYAPQDKTHLKEADARIVAKTLLKAFKN